MNSIIKPTGKFPNFEGKQSGKFTIADAEESFTLHLVCVNNYEVKVQGIREKCFQTADTLQPIILVVGSGIYKLKEFFVLFDNVLYKRRNYLESLTTCFQIFHVLNLKYPLACQNAWLFIQKYFFDIQTPFDNHSNAVISLLHFLKSKV